MATALSLLSGTEVAEPRPAAPRVGRPALVDRAGSGLALRWSGRLALLGLGGWLSLFRLSTPSWGLDEPTYAAAGRAYWRGDFGPNPEHPPLAKYLIGAAEWLFGPTVTAARLPAALMLLATGLVAWAWLARVGPRGAGPIAALLVWTVPVLTTFPEALDRAPDTATLTRTAMLDPVAAGLALAALAVGWWWLRSGRLPAAAACGLLSLLACTAKLAAALIIVVPAVAGCLAVAGRPGTLPARLGRLAAHVGAWLAAAAVAVVATYAPMGWPGALDTFRRGYAKERRHGHSGHLIVVSGRPRLHGPWWIDLAWQRASWGTALSVVAVLAVLLGLLARSGLTAYLAAAGLLPVVALTPLTGLALPHYLLLWRPVLIVAAVVGGTAGVRWLAGAARRGTRPPDPGWPGARRATGIGASGIGAGGIGLGGVGVSGIGLGGVGGGGAGTRPVGARRDAVRRAVVVAVAAVLAVPPAAAAGRSITALATLRPTGYAALPGLVPPGGTVWLVGDYGAGQFQLPGRRFPNLASGRADLTARPDAIVLDRGFTRRGIGAGLDTFADRYGYHLVRSGALDIWLRPRP